MHFPAWLEIVAIVSLASGVASAVVIIVDILAGRKQHMWIMNVVWPVTALYGSPFALWAYYKWGRLSSQMAMREAKQKGEEPAAKRKPFWEKCATGATHCGSGCALGDLIAEWGLVLFPFYLFGRRIFATWAVDFVFAFLLGIAFQYFTIKPMRGLSVRGGLTAALKADALSLTAWQIGMYGWMAIATFLIFHQEIPKTTPVFWFMMQVAMWFGFTASFPVNWFLLKSGAKEPM